MHDCADECWIFMLEYVKISQLILIICHLGKLSAAEYGYNVPNL